MRTINIFKKAWQITWNHKILWLFGVLNTLYSKWERPEGLAIGLGEHVGNFLSSIFNYFRGWVTSTSTSNVEYGTVIGFSEQLLMVLVIFAIPSLGFIAIYKGALEVMNGNKVNLKKLASLGLFRLQSVVGVIFISFWLSILAAMPILEQSLDDPLGLFIGILIWLILFTSQGYFAIIYGPVLLEDLNLWDSGKRAWSLFWTAPVFILWVTFINRSVVDITNDALIRLFGSMAYLIGILPYAIVETFTSVVIVVLFLSLPLEAGEEKPQTRL